MPKMGWKKETPTLFSYYSLFPEKGWIKKSPKLNFSLHLKIGPRTFKFISQSTDKLTRELLCVTTHDSGYVLRPMMLAKCYVSWFYRALFKLVSSSVASPLLHFLGLPLERALRESHIWKPGSAGILFEKMMSSKSRGLLQKPTEAFLFALCDR